VELRGGNSLAFLSSHRNNLTQQDPEATRE
jgi:hypothetical protein